MTIRSSVLYAKKLIFSKKTDDGSRSNGKRSLLGAMICIGISLVPLVAVLVISEGMIQGITGRMIGLSSRDLSVYINSGSESVISADIFTKAAYSLSQVDGITGAYPEIQGTALAAGKSSRTGATVRAVQNDLFTADKDFSTLFSVVEGSTDFSQANDAIIGQKISEVLNVHVGDVIRLITVSTYGANAVVPRTQSFTVRGIVSCGYQELDALWVFIPIKTGYTFLPRESSQFIVGLTTNDSFSNTLYETQNEVQEATYGNRNINPIGSAYVYRWDEINAAEFGEFFVYKIVASAHHAPHRPCGKCQHKFSACHAGDGASPGNCNPQKRRCDFKRNYLLFPSHGICRGNRGNDNWNSIGAPCRGKYKRNHFIYGENG